MKKVNLLTALPLFVLLVMGFSPAGFAQDQDQPQNPDQQQQQTPDPQQSSPNDTTQMQLEQSIRGQLKSVDTDAKKIVVTTSDGTDMEFVYNDQTLYSGAQDTIEGLSTSSGSNVTVHYRDENQQKVATKIEVEAASEKDESGTVMPRQKDQDTPPPDTERPNPPDPNRPQDNPEQPLPAPPQ